MLIPVEKIQPIEEDKPVYVKSLWVELKNEEGDIIYLNRDTGETSLKNPEIAHSLSQSGEKWVWIPDHEEAWIPAKLGAHYGDKIELESTNGIKFKVFKKILD